MTVKLGREVRPAKTWRSSFDFTASSTPHSHLEPFTPRLFADMFDPFGIKSLLLQQAFDFPQLVI